MASRYLGTLQLARFVEVFGGVSMQPSRPSLSDCRLFPQGMLKVLERG